MEAPSSAIQTLVEVPSSNGEVVEVPESSADYPPLSTEEDTFALAMIEYGGNLLKAYRSAFGDDQKMPTAKAKQLLNKPGVALRIRELSDSIQEATYITLGTHLAQLAAIRDEAFDQGQLKVAYTAERSRGEVVGLYNRFQHGDGKDKTPVAIQITFASPHDKSI